MRFESGHSIDDEFLYRPKTLTHTAIGTMDRADGEVSTTTQFIGIFEEYPPGKLSGKLYDLEGEREITGELTEGELTFVTWPSESSVSQFVSFRYAAVDYGEWQGHYEVIREGLVFYGETSCQTSEVTATR